MESEAPTSFAALYAELSDANLVIQDAKFTDRELGRGSYGTVHEVGLYIFY